VNEAVSLFEKKQLTNNVGAPVADNQNAMKAGSGFCALKWCGVFPTTLKVFHCHPINR